MFQKSTLIAAPLALAIGLAMVVPAQAQGRYGPSELRAQIDHLDDRVERASRTDRLSDGELNRLRQQVDALKQRYRNFSRNGFTRSELQNLDERIDNLSDRIGVDIRDQQRDRR